MLDVVVLGGSGMLGAMLADCLADDAELKVAATVRRQDLVDQLRQRLPAVEWRMLDAETCGDVSSIARLLDAAAWAVNAIGVIKPYTHDDNPVEVERAVRVNSVFPHLLARAAEKLDCRVLQIATDCAYSGRRGGYVETDAHDALDVYGKTKSLGEVYSDKVHHLRCSIIGPEPKAYVSLLEWFLRQPHTGAVNGYANHKWNGVTTLHFARLCRAVMKQGVNLPHMQHVIPSGSISKADLLHCFAREFGRQDITITPTEAKTVIDRTLSTSNDALNRQLWEAAGYAHPPSVPDMVAELAGFDFRPRNIG